MTEWDTTVDVLVAGTGGAGLATAVAALDAGLSVLLLESTERWGGSTAMSGGGMWLPDNPLMRREDAGDSREEALAYMEATIGDAGPAASRERKEAFVDSVGEFVTMAERLGVSFERAAEYPDYYPELPGGKIGRLLEVTPFDRTRIGRWWDVSRAQSDGLPLPMKTDDAWLLSRAWSTPSGFARGARFVGRTLAGFATGSPRVGMGAALTCSFLEVALQQGVRLWLSAPLEELVVEDGRVVGGVVRRDGTAVRVGAERGVMLAAGGFAHREAWRKQHHGVPGWSSASPGNLGTVIELGIDAGGAVDLMDDAWWGASVPPATSEHRASFVLGERSMPHGIIVDAQGRRFANESESYVDLGHHMLDHDVDGPFWLVTEARHSRRYLRSYLMEPGAGDALREAGHLHGAETLEELAAALSMEPSTLRATVSRFNGFARTGIDQDFGRGNSFYDRYYGDPSVHPNPNLGPLEKGPFTAVRLVPGDLGTKGGLVTDVDGRVVGEDGGTIAGLHASGNTTASVMGRTYPGPGATIGPAMVFGMRAARAMATPAG